MYLDEYGHYTDDSIRAKSFALIQKLQDTLYLFREFDKNNNLLLQGCYKDSSVNIANGQFIFYEKASVESSSDVSTPIDTSIYVKTTGFYSNGIKNGIWTYYLSKNIKNYSCTFVNGKLNGLYTKYAGGNSNYIGLEGHFVDNKKEGEWKSYDSLKSVLISSTFLHDTLVNEVHHSRDITPPDSFYTNMNRLFEPVLKKYSDTGLQIIFSVDVDGTVGDIRFDEDVSKRNTKLITDAIISSGKFQPAIYNDKPFKDTYILEVSKQIRYNPYPNTRNRIYIKHTDLIGRGLNTVGIGTPLDDK